MKINLLVYVLLLFLSCFNPKSFTSNLLQNFYDPDLDQCIYKPSDTTTYHKNIIFADNDGLPQPIKEYIKLLESNEHLFRDSRKQSGKDISEDQNIAQFCFHIFDKDNSYKRIDASPVKNCSGVFYLSGTQPIKIEDKTPHLTTHMDTQKAVLPDKSFIEIKQRRQPMAESISFTLNALQRYSSFLHIPAIEDINLDQIAYDKLKQTHKFMDSKDALIKKIQTMVVQRSQDLVSLDTLEKNADIFFINFLKELITALEMNDFSFFTLGDALKNKNIQKFIDQIKQELSNDSIQDLFNSKHFNLGCSEPLLLSELALDVRFAFFKNIFKKQTNAREVYIHLHSTKTPCKSCLVTCCAHSENGIVQKFRQMIQTELKQNDLPVYFLVSFEKVYKSSTPYNILIPKYDSTKQEAPLLYLYKTMQ